MLTRLLTDSLSLVFGHLETVFKVCGAWFGLQFVLSILLLLSTGGQAFDGENDVISPATGVLLMVNTILAFVSAASIAVAWHRFGLRGDDVGPIHLRFGLVELLFLLKMAVIGIVSSVLLIPMIFVAFIPSDTLMSGVLLVAILAGFFLLFSLVMRFNLVLPATAVEQPLGFMEAFQMGKGLGWRMLLAIIALSLPLIFVALGLQYVLSQFSFGLPALLIQLKLMVLNVLLQIILTVLGISVITSAYRMALERAARP
ncbi:hypothetical protein E1180_17720 [Roseibium denhamense]|uniref:ABC transporter permease n=1 Tax=Roseibium denhamense TaxID=76305 RepID=A0ABY1PAM6_9HYPH|nr:hypothetical protein [Roseibium denhamense]MTI07344.1 hypothetical protein [Roseibium denhamense]SMP28949.1 hypothetical protein SAMN06265374_3033 [Roseibium denhamense]